MPPRQQKAVWCWAACLQWVLERHGISLSQQEIVDRAKAKGQISDTEEFSWNYQLGPIIEAVSQTAVQVAEHSWDATDTTPLDTLVQAGEDVLLFLGDPISSQGRHIVVFIRSLPNGGAHVMDPATGALQDQAASWFSQFRIVPHSIRFP